MFRSLIFLLCLLGLNKVWAAPQVSFKGDGLSYLIEEQVLTIEDLMKLPPETMKKVQGFRPSFGFDSRAYWLRAEVQNTTGEDTPIIFEVVYPRLEYLDFHAVDASGRILEHYRTGTERSARSKPVNHLNFAFPVTVPASSSLTLYLRTSSHSPIRFPVKIWEPEEFREAQQNTLILQGLYFGGIVIMVAYNLFVFLATRTPSYFYYSMFVVFTALYLAGEGGILLRYVFTEAASWNNRLTLSSIIGANITGLMFVTWFMGLKEHDARIDRLIRFMVPLLLASLSLVYVLPYHIVGLSYTIVSTITAGFLITTTVRGFMRHQREAYFYAAAWACLLLGTFAFALLNLGFLPLNPFTEKSLQIGSLFEVLILSLALADRLNQLRIGLKTANNSLAYQIEHVEEQVQHKTRDIRSIMEHIPLGVFSIAADQSIHKDYSRSMKELFHRENIAGENAMTVLFENAVVSADEKDRIKATLLHVLGEDLLNFEINRPSLPESMILDWQEQRHTYNLTWNPVCNDRNQVDKILVTVHDSTRLLTLEKEAETQRRKLAMIQKILDVPPVRFHSFLRQADHLLEDCRTILEESSEHAPELHLVLMNIHTLKGTARSLSFDEISELCHEAEECSRSGNIPALRGYISDLRQLVERYRSIEAEKFGRGRATGENLRLELEVLQGLIQDLRQGTQHHLRTLEMALYRPLEEVLQHGMQSAARLADELGKMRPEIRIEAAGYGLSQEGYDALSGIFIHIVRNSLDHGLETANERIAKGKPASGCMEIQVSSDGKQCFLDFTDDGRGLDLALLARKGRALGLLPENPGPQDVAELIFVPEFSTRDNVSKISGRGVGLSAVRETLKRHGGDVYLIMDDAASPFRRFHLRLKLPLSYWIRYHEEAYRRSA